MGTSLSAGRRGVSSRRRAPVGRYAGIAVAAAVVVVASWAFAFVMGLAPWLGFASHADGSGASGLVSRFGGTSFGLKTFPLVAGQEFFVRYDIDVRAGGLGVGLAPLLPASGGRHGVSLRASGNGEIVFPVRETGIYRVRLGHTTPGGDLRYRLFWGARPSLD